MCGFLGEISFNKNLSDSKKFENYSNLLNNRGPDSSNYLSDNVFYQFSFKRLSIFDPTPNGNQPMLSKCKRYICMLNGAIYNFKKLKKKIIEKKKYNFQSNSDTEVLLVLWTYYKRKTVNLLDGMFAFIIWDNEKKILYIFRDRAGEKPLYYHHDNNKFFFCSSPLPIVKLLKEKKISHQAKKNYLQNGYFESEESIFANVKKLNSASYILLSKKKLYLEKYWNFEKINYIKKNSIKDLVNHLEEILISSINQNLNSDRPVGLFLSGGIDSTLIATLTKKKLKRNDIKSFTLGHDERYHSDESKSAQKTSEYLGIENINFKCNPLEIIKQVDEIYKNIHEPFFDPAVLLLMFLSKNSKKYIDVAISGDGGDELFGGYKHYNLGIFYKKLSKVKILLNVFSDRMIEKTFNHRGILLIKYLKKNNLSKAFQFLRSIKKDYPSIEIVDQSILNNHNKNNNLISHEIIDLLKYDFDNIFKNLYLPKVDLATMFYSLECRTPFLSKNLIEFAFSIKDKHKLNLFQNKIILIKLLEKHLPKELISGKKRGFEFPLKSWLRNELKDWSKEIISDDRNYKELNINKEKVLDIFSLHQSRKRDCHPYIWSIIMLLKYNKKILLNF